jgi:hypothetical protein
MALKQFENEFDLSDKVTPYFLDLIAHRVFLMEQVVWCYASITSIVVDWEGKSVYDVSHSDISADALKGKSSSS